MKIFHHIIFCLFFTHFLLTSAYLSATNTDTLEIKALKVIKIVDGDTIWVSHNNKTLKIRLLGIQAPEINTTPKEPFGVEATNKITALLENKTVNIVFSKKHKYDKYQRILGDVYVINPLTNEPLWINRALVQDGLAFVYILNSTPILGIKELIEAENIAIEQKINYWSLLENQPIAPEDSNNYLNNYKLVSGKIININQTKNSTWLQMEDNGQLGFSVRIDKKYLEDFIKIYPLDALIGKNVYVRGFIDKYSPKYGAFINLQNPYALEIK